MVVWIEVLYEMRFLEIFWWRRRGRSRVEEEISEVWGWFCNFKRRRSCSYIREDKEVDLVWVFFYV